MAENNKDIFKITLNVYNRTLPVNCTREDEEKYRKSAKLITDLVNFYSSRYAGQKNDVDILYMVLIDVAMRYHKSEERNDVEPLMETLKGLTDEIEDALGIEPTSV